MVGRRAASGRHDPHRMRTRCRTWPRLRQDVPARARRARRRDLDRAARDQDRDARGDRDRTSGARPCGAFAPVVLGSSAVFIAVPGVASRPDGRDIAADVGEAAARAAMLLVYLLALSRSARRRGCSRYHGAEHMAIAAFERTDGSRRSTKRAESPVHVRAAPTSSRCSSSWGWCSPSSRESSWLGGSSVVASVRRGRRLRGDACAAVRRGPSFRACHLPGRHSADHDRRPPTTRSSRLAALPDRSP